MDDRAEVNVREEASLYVYFSLKERIMSRHGLASSI